jgi:hypothetical protein
MADTPHPPPDDGPDPDPAEADLVAYLDGELDPAAARRVEARMAADPKLRARAEGLKRSYDLLDFLPKSEPSPTFATRTLEKLPAVKSSPAAPAVAASPVASGSQPVLIGSGTGTPGLSAANVVPAAAGWGWALGLVVVVAAALGTGYAGTAAARAYLFPPPKPAELTADNLTVTDLRIVELLPLYAAADDFEFVERLAAPDQFGDDAAGPAGPAAELDKPDGAERDALLAAFRDLPPDRLDKIRLLDQQVHALPPQQRVKTLRVLENYAAWLQRLPDADRKRVLAAPSADDRLAAIEDARKSQWMAGLPAAHRAKLANLAIQDRAELVAKLKTEEDTRREAWQTARFSLEVVKSGRQLWPFTEEAMKKQVLDFARAAYQLDEPKKKRLSPPDLARFQEAVERAEKGGEWVWLGKAVYDFSLAPTARYATLPDAGPKGRMVLDATDIVAGPFRENLLKRLSNKVTADAGGKWPEFALAVHRELGKFKFGAKAIDLSLGPAAPGEYKDDVQRFLPVLQAKATPAEWKALREKEGKWPDHPAELMRLARLHDLCVPGAMPPGPPGRWDQTYSLPINRPFARPGAE